MISFSVIARSLKETIALVPCTHWAAIGLLTLAAVAIPLVRKKTKPYGALALGLAFFTALVLLESTVVVRACGFVNNGWGVHLNFDFDRLRHINQLGYEALFNIVAFVPFGFFLAEYLAVAKRTGAWRRIGYATLATFLLSLLIEALQLLLKVGFFELTDLLLNTAGGFAGALIAALFRFFVYLCNN